MAVLEDGTEIFVNVAAGFAKNIMLKIVLRRYPQSTVNHDIIYPTRHH